MYGSFCIKNFLYTLPSILFGYLNKKQSRADNLLSILGSSKNYLVEGFQVQHFYTFVLTLIYAAQC